MLEPMRWKLKVARDNRKQPLLDTKVLTSWNALMIRALAHAGRFLHDERYTQAAARAAQFILDTHRRKDGVLYRASREGRTRYEGFLDDYAFLAQALLALKLADKRGKWKELAIDVIEAMTQRFGDHSGAGGFYFTDYRSTELIVQQKTAGDSPLPSGNAAATMSLLTVGRVDEARQTIAAFAQQLQHKCEGMSALVEATLLYLRRGGERFTVSAGTAVEPSAKGEAISADRPLTPQQVAERVVRIGGDWISPVELHVRLSILHSYHVNAHDPGAGGAESASVVPTRLTIDAAAVAQPPTIEYPAGLESNLAFADAPIRVYDGDVTIVVRFSQPVTSDLRLSLTYQACDDSACLPPVTKRVEVPPP
jgi:hypothetical protein